MNNFRFDEAHAIDELKSRGFPFSSWDHLARVVQCDPRASHSDVYEEAIVFYERERLRARIQKTLRVDPDALKHESETPQSDTSDDYVTWLGRPLYLGRNTQMRRVFTLLTDPVGVARTLDELRRAVDDGLPYDSDDEIERANARVRRVICNLKKRLSERNFDDHVMIVCQKVKTETKFKDMHMGDPAGVRVKWDRSYSLIHRFS